MKGIVKYININNGLCAIELENNDFTIFEDFDGILAIDDIVSGNLKNLGEETIYNLTQNMEVNGFIENTDCSKNQLLTQLKIN